MWSKRKDQDKIHHEEERYQFIKEQVQPQRRLQIQKWASYFGVLLVSALFFGVVAGGIIVLLQNHFVESKEQVIDRAVYTSAPEKATDVPDSSYGKQEEGQGISFFVMDRLTKRLAKVGEQAKCSLVGISKKDSMQDWPLEQKSGQEMGYGVIIEETNTFYYILTDRNIVKGHSAVTVHLRDDTTIEGEVLSGDTHLDLAVVRVSKMEIKTNVSGQMKAIKAGDKSGLEKGTNVIAVGCPNGVLYSVVSGRVTNDSVSAGFMDGEIRLYCTDIPYSQEGGGIILDTTGKVVGVIATGFAEKTGTTGMAFIGVEDVLNAFELLKHKESAPYFGIEGSSLSNEAADAHQLAAGAYVTEVYYGSPAYNSGIRVADVITGIDNKRISGMYDIYQILLKHKQGDIITCKVSRKSWGEQIEKKLKIKLQ